MRSSMLGFVFLVAFSSAVSGQGSIQGVVTSGHGRAIAGAEVRIDALGLSTRTGQRGGFELATPAGPHSVTVRAIGYQATTMLLRVIDGKATDVEIELRPVPQVLDSVVTVGEGPPAVRGKMSAVEERRLLNVGKHVTRAQLAERENSLLSDVLRMTGIPLIRRPDVCGGGWSAATSRGSGSMRTTDKNRCNISPRRMPEACYMTVYVDGMRVWVDNGNAPPLDIDFMNPRELEAVEVYRGAGEAPAQYMGLDNSCGVILLWTRER